VGSVWVCRRGTGFGQGQDKLRVAMGGYGEAGDGCSRGADLGAQILDMDNIRNISRIWRLLRNSIGSERHWLTPTARAASTASTSTSSRAASLRCAAMRARSQATRRSSIELAEPKPTRTQRSVGWQHRGAGRCERRRVLHVTPALSECCSLRGERTTQRRQR
jgi:hypothetical protein